MKHKSIRKHSPLPPSVVKELELLILELDLVPLSIFPPEVHHIVKQYYTTIEDTDADFDPITQVSINIKLRNRRYLKNDDSNQLILFVPDVH